MCMKPILHKLAICLLAVTCWAAFAHPHVRAQEAMDEAMIKSAYIYNFMKFVEWPPEYDPVTFNLCLLGSNPFGSVIESLTGKTIRNHPIRVITNVPLSQAQYCHAVFVSRSEAGRLSGILLKLHEKPILTISDIEGFAERGGIIELMTSPRGDIDFRISQESAQRAHLRISSKLLSLSK